MKLGMITIVDYGMGNLGSIQNMFKRIGAKARISADPRDLESAEKILLPGVGAFDGAMERINSGGFRDILDRKALVERVPVLGICLGMQLLTRSSEEGNAPGLGWFAAETLRFRKRTDSRCRTWDGMLSLHRDRANDGGTGPGRPLLFRAFLLRPRRPCRGFRPQSPLWGDLRRCRRSRKCLRRAISPEKSHRFGMQLLSNFARL